MITHLFALTVICVVLLLLLATSAVEPEDDINNTVCIDNETESVDISCGNVPETATTIEWFITTSNGWKRIMKVDHTESGEFQRRNIGHNEDKYDISESLNTYLVVRNIRLSDNNLFKCSATGRSHTYTYTTMLKVVGKYYLVWNLT